MSKIKIYELAKELNVPSREVLEFLNGKNIEVKNHMSALEEADADVVRKSFVKAEAAPAKPEQEAPKKKNIVHVFRPQNTQNGAKQGRRPGAKAGQPQGKPMQVNNGRPAKAAPARPAAPAEKVQQAKRPAAEAAKRPAAAETEAAKRPAAPAAAEAMKRPASAVGKPQGGAGSDRGAERSRAFRPS